MNSNSIKRMVKVPLVMKYLTILCCLLHYARTVKGTTFNMYMIRKYYIPVPFLPFIFVKKKLKKA